MSLTYTSYVATMENLAAQNPTSLTFQQILPSMLDYAQDRIDRDLALLSTVASNSTLGLTSNNRQLDITAANVNVLQRVNVITPAGTVAPSAGTRVPVVPTTEDYLDAVWGSASGASVPQYFCMLTPTVILFGPWPDSNYQVELVGTVRQQGLSATTPQTWVSTYLPDLLIAASMVFMSGYMRNFGSQSDDPKMAQSWEGQYQTLKDSSYTEDQRRKFASTGWTSILPEKLTPPRT